MSLDSSTTTLKGRMDYRECITLLFRPVAHLRRVRMSNEPLVYDGFHSRRRIRVQ